MACPRGPGGVPRARDARTANEVERTASKRKPTALTKLADAVGQGSVTSPQTVSVGSSATLMRSAEQDSRFEAFVRKMKLPE
jgi:hypothetical protein